jgi:ethanolamine kinase
MTQEEIDRDSVLMRAYGNNTDILIDRDREATSHLTCAKHGLAPPLLARFNNGLLYRYIPGDVCTPQDLIDEAVWRPVARRLGQWHATLPVEAVSVTNGTKHADTNGHSQGIVSRKPSPNIWTVMRGWVRALPQDNTKQQTRKASLEQELERSFSDLDNTDGPGLAGFVFGHCVRSDLLSFPVLACAGRYPSHTSNQEICRMLTI